MYYSDECSLISPFAMYIVNIVWTTKIPTRDHCDFSGRSVAREPADATANTRTNTFVGYAATSDMLLLIGAKSLNISRNSAPQLGPAKP